MLWLWSSLAFAADCDPSAPLARAEQAVLEARLDVARSALRDVEAAFGCGAVAPREVLATAWLIEGAVETFGGDREAAAEAFVAASRTAPDLWLGSLGARLKADRDAAIAAASPGSGSLEVTGPPAGAFLAIDGVPTTSPARLAPGLHLVQAGRAADAVVWGKVVYLPPDQRVAVDVPAFSPAAAPEPAPAAPAPAPEPAPAAPATVPEPPPDRGTGLFAHAALGGASVFGDPLVVDGGDQGRLDEPAVKVSVPIEVGAVLRPSEALWLRAAAGTAPLIGGRLVYATGEGATAWPVAVFAHGSVGGSVGPADLGLLGGISLPGRIELRGTGSVALGSAPLRLELRGGVNAATARAVEPAVGLLLALDPRGAVGQ